MAGKSCQQDFKTADGTMYSGSICGKWVLLQGFRNSCVVLLESNAA